MDEVLSSTLETMRVEALGEHQLTVESCDNHEQSAGAWLQTKIDSETKALNRLAEKIIKTMASFREAFKLDTAEMDASLEADFGRGSDESTQYGLKLFRQFNLQLLIVTPLQKIHVIEPFVSSVGFVHIEGGRISKLRNLSIEEYRAQKALTAPHATPGLAQ